MTVSQLYASVAQLGFEDTLEYDSGFIYAANRALLQICMLRPEIRYCIIDHSPLNNLVTGAGFAPVMKTEDLIYEAQGAVSYYFEVCGLGVVYIEKYNTESKRWEHIGDNLTFDTPIFTAYRGFILDGGDTVEGRARLRFSGEYAYSVRCVAMYGVRLRPEAEHIPPFTEYLTYDISLIAPDFLALDTPPVKADDGYVRLASGYRVESGRAVLLPRSSPGLYKIAYIHKPQEISHEILPTADNTNIDIDGELCTLMPLLIASYVWADDEPEKAQYYQSLYQSRAAEILSRGTKKSPLAMRDIYGWV